MLYSVIPIGPGRCQAKLKRPKAFSDSFGFGDENEQRQDGFWFINLVFDPGLGVAGPGRRAGFVWKNFCADGRTNTMPVQWEQVSRKIIAHLDQERLERGEVISEIKRINSQTVAAQAWGSSRPIPRPVLKWFVPIISMCRLCPGRLKTGSFGLLSWKEITPALKRSTFGPGERSGL